jgi:hypothetical protein
MFLSALYNGNYADPIAGESTQPSLLALLSMRSMEQHLASYGFCGACLTRGHEETDTVMDCFRAMGKENPEACHKVAESLDLAIRVYRIGAELNAPFAKLLVQERLFRLIGLILTAEGLEQSCRDHLFATLADAVIHIYKHTEQRDMIRSEVLTTLFCTGDRGDGAYIPHLRDALTSCDDFLRRSVEAVRHPLRHGEAWRDLLYEVVTEVSGDRMDDEVISGYSGMEDWV